MNSLSKEIFPERRSLRLPDYDYSSQGAYFITICSYKKQNVFAKVIEGTSKLNQLGEIVLLCWKEIPLHYPEADNNVFIVMPNHIHGIICIRDPGRASSKLAPTGKHPLSEIIRGFKTYSTRKINEKRNSPRAPLWQRGYYEHVIRDEDEYRQIGEYIQFNASRWKIDAENPEFRPT